MKRFFKLVKEFNDLNNEPAEVLERIVTLPIDIIFALVFIIKHPRVKTQSKPDTEDSK